MNRLDLFLCFIFLMFCQGGLFAAGSVDIANIPFKNGVLAEIIGTKVVEWDKYCRKFLEKLTVCGDHFIHGSFDIEAKSFEGTGRISCDSIRIKVASWDFKGTIVCNGKCDLTIASASPVELNKTAFEGSGTLIINGNTLGERD